MSDPRDGEESSRHVFVTGANGGFGLPTATGFAREGWRVTAGVRRAEGGAALVELARTEGLPIEVVPLDVTDPDSVTRAVQRARSRNGDVDCLINVAGIGNLGALEDQHEAELRRIMETNFFGPVRMMRAVLPDMRRRRSGTIINLSSLAGRLGIPCESAYSASKFALEGATESLQYEVARFGVHVAIVEPGYFRTGMSESSDLDRSCPKDSPYRDLCEFLHRGEKAAEAQGEDPQLVAKMLIEAATSEAPRLRWLPGEMAPSIIALREGLDDAGLANVVRNTLEIEWWTRGEEAPVSL